MVGCILIEDGFLMAGNFFVEYRLVDGRNFWKFYLMNDNLFLSGEIIPFILFSAPCSWFGVLSWVIEHLRIWEYTHAVDLVSTGVANSFRVLNNARQPLKKLHAWYAGTSLLVCLENCNFHSKTRDSIMHSYHSCEYLFTNLIYLIYASEKLCPSSPVHLVFRFIRFSKGQSLLKQLIKHEFECFIRCYKTGKTHEKVFIVRLFGDPRWIRLTSV